MGTLCFTSKNSASQDFQVHNLQTETAQTELKLSWQQTSVGQQAV